MARRWVKAGHRVTLVCGRSELSGLPPITRWVTPVQIDGIDLRVLRIAYANHQGFIARIGVFLGFILWSVVAGLRVKDVDVIFSTSTPLTIGIPAMLLKLFKRVPFVFEVRDQWPEVPIEMGYIRNRFLRVFLLWLERRIYKSSAAIVALSPGMAKGVQTVLGNVRRPVVVAPNSSDTELFRPDIDGACIRHELGWENKFVIMHFGAMGRANGLDFLIDAAKRLQEYADLLFVLIGEGSEKERLRAKVQSLGVTNVRVVDTFPKERMPNVVAAADVSTVIFAAYPILEQNSANKLFDSLSAGKPILLNYGGWQRQLIESAGCGFGCTQYDLGEYVERVEWFFKNCDRLDHMGRNSRDLAIREFGRDQISTRVLTLIESVKSENKHGNP